MVSLIAYFATSSAPSVSKKALADHSSECSRSTSRISSYEEALQGLLLSRSTKEASQVPCNFIPQCIRAARAEQREVERKSVSGKVTSVHECGGLIDNFIYFDVGSVSSFMNEDLPAIGDGVQVDAERLRGGCWRALRVTKISEGDCDNFESSNMGLYSDCAIGCISAIEETAIKLERGLSFEIESLSDGFKPCIGDWVKLNPSRKGSPSVLAPLRTKEISGKVTVPPKYDANGHETRVGNINGNVQFSLDSCESGYIPGWNDEVIVTAIECRQKWYTWRALKVRFLKKGNRLGVRDSGFGANDWVIRGGFPERHCSRPSVPTFLPKYAVPAGMRRKVIEGLDVLSETPSLKEDLNLENYAERFSALIHLEEISAEEEIEKYGLRGAHLVRRGEYLCLNVPGLADERPKLSAGDMVALRDSGNNSSTTQYHGFIHHVIPDGELVTLKFHPEFQENFDTFHEYDIDFKYSRIPFRRCHFAVRLAQKRGLDITLFPTDLQKNAVESSPISDSINSPQTLNSQRFSKFFNDNLNARQKEAVLRILAGEAKPRPYILFGPPGTGKTVTLVEVILQLYFSYPSSRILVCAPSNSAVDLICERISITAMVNESDMVRFNAIRRLKNSIPDSISKYCHEDEDVHLTSRYRIILTTCMNSGMFYSLRLPMDHFTHVCIDEAGQSTEPETLVPLGLQMDAQIIMAGDPQQLGPVVKSPLASTYGLSKSLLERLMESEIYQYSGKFADGYNPVLVTKLRKNYRCHAKLIELSSKLFYMDELEPCREGEDYSELLNWKYLPRKGFPIIFHGITGQQLRESDSPSLMNPAEIIQVTRYIKVLTRDMEVKTSDIGVLTPYRKQVEKVRLMLKSVNIDGVKVGSVEEFQGQEKSVIILSTVRSYRSFEQSRLKDNLNKRAALGFLSNYKRFNVAITRAKDLMIVIGNPEVLKLDENWNALLSYTKANGGYTVYT